MNFGICWVSWNQSPVHTEGWRYSCKTFIKGWGYGTARGKKVKKKSTEGAWNLQARLPRVCYVHKMNMYFTLGLNCQYFSDKSWFQESCPKVSRRLFYALLGIKAKPKSLNGHARCNSSINKLILGASREVLNLKQDIS